MLRRLVRGRRPEVPFAVETELVHARFVREDGYVDGLWELERSVPTDMPAADLPVAACGEDDERVAGRIAFFEAERVDGEILEGFRGRFDLVQRGGGRRVPDDDGRVRACGEEDGFPVQRSREEAFDEIRVAGELSRLFLGSQRGGVDRLVPAAAEEGFGLWAYREAGEGRGATDRCSGYLGCLTVCQLQLRHST